MATWFPISHSVLQYVDSSGNPYSGAVLKAYSAGTSTNISLATDSLGVTTVSSITLNAAGYPSVSGNIVIPYVSERYKLALYPTQAAADANSGAIWNPDSIPITTDLFGTIQSLTASTALDSADSDNVLEFNGTFTIDLPAITSGIRFSYRNKGTGLVTIDPNGSELINGSSTLSVYPGDSGIVVPGDTAWTAFANTVNYRSVSQLYTKGADIASATTTDLSAATGDFVDITGTTTITGLGTVTAGVKRTLQFDGALTLTHNATSLILPGGVSITTVAGDVADFVSLGSGNWICTNYQKVNGLPVVGGLVLQNIKSSIAATSSTSDIPDDDTPPTSSEGTEIWSGSITPKDNTNEVIIKGSVNVYTSGGSYAILTLFNGTTALKTYFYGSGAGVLGGTIDVFYQHAPASASAQTYSLRIGRQTGSGITVYVNQLSAAKYNGLLAGTSMVLQEIAV